MPYLLAELVFATVLFLEALRQNEPDTPDAST